MKKDTCILLFLLIVFFLAAIIACSPQAKAVTPTTQPTASFTPLPTGTNTPAATASPAATATFALLLRPLSEALPSGQYLAYIFRDCISSNPQPCNLKAISLSGALNQFLGPIPYSGSSASDFTDSKGQLAYTVGWVDQNSNALPSTIQVFDLGRNRTFEVPVPDQRNCSTQDWSPDGTRLVVLCNSKYGSTVIGLLSVPDGKLTVLLNKEDQGVPQFQYEQPRWSPDGKWLSFYERNLCSDCQAVENLYVTDMSCLSAPSTCEAKTRQVSLPAQNGPAGTATGWTPDGKLFRVANNRIEIYDVNGDRLVRSIDVNLSGDQAQSAVWSPDGKWIAITGVHNSIYLMSSVGGDLKSLMIAGARPFWLAMP